MSSCTPYPSSKASFKIVCIPLSDKIVSSCKSLWLIFFAFSSDERVWSRSCWSCSSSALNLAASKMFLNNKLKCRIRMHGADCQISYYWLYGVMALGVRERDSLYNCTQSFSRISISNTISRNVEQHLNCRWYVVHIHSKEWKMSLVVLHALVWVRSDLINLTMMSIEALWCAASKASKTLPAD